MKKWKINMSEHLTKVSDLGMVSSLYHFTYQKWPVLDSKSIRPVVIGPKWTVIGHFWINAWDPVTWNHLSLTVEKTRRYVNDISDDNLADFIDNFAKMVLIDYTKLDFPSLLVYLCQRRGTRKYIGDMFEVCQFVNHTWVMWHDSYTREYSFVQI